MKTEVAGTPV